MSATADISIVEEGVRVIIERDNGGLVTVRFQAPEHIGRGWRNLATVHAMGWDNDKGAVAPEVVTVEQGEKEAA